MNGWVDTATSKVNNLDFSPEKRTVDRILNHKHYNIKLFLCVTIISGTRSPRLCDFD